MSQTDNNNNSMGSGGIQLPTTRLSIEAPLQAVGSAIHGRMAERLGCRPQWRPWMWQLARWARDNRGQGLLLYGPPGTGKTFIVQHALLPLMKKVHGFSVSFFTRDDLCNASKRIETPIYKVLDGVGNEPPMGKGAAGLFRFERIVETATRERQLLIITTTLYPPDLLDRYGPSTHDRLKLLRAINCYGESMRDINLIINREKQQNENEKEQQNENENREEKQD